VDDHATGDEQACADGSAECNQVHVPLLQRLLQPSGIAGGLAVVGFDPCHCHCRSTPVAVATARSV